MVPSCRRTSSINGSWRSSDASCSLSANRSMTSDASVLEDREEYWRLLHEYDKQAGVLPPEETKEKGRKADKPPEAELLETEITTLQDLARGQRSRYLRPSLADLGKARAQKVQDLLLGAGDIEPGRLFIINSGPAPTEGELVRMNLSLR